MLVEILIAMAVFTLTSAAIIMLFWGGQKTNYDDTNVRHATNYARNGLEITRTMRDNAWDYLDDGTWGLVYMPLSSSWDLYGHNNVEDNLTRTVNIVTDDNGNKTIVSSVSWSTQTSDTNQSVVLTDMLSSPNEGLNGDWTKMRLINTYNAGSNGAATDVAYYKNRVYVTNAAAPGNAPDFYIFDVASASNPIYKSSLDVEQGLQAVAVSGSYAYVIEKNSSDFFILNIASATAPYVVSKITLNGGNGRSVAVMGHYVYASTTYQQGGQEFFVIDPTNKSAPAVVASLDERVDINKINALDDVVYSATSSDSAELWLFDVSNPLNPQASASYNGNNTGDGSAVFAKATDHVFLGRSQNQADRQLYWLDASVRPIVSVNSQSVDTNINDLLAVGNLLFDATNKTDKAVQDYYENSNNQLQHYDDIKLSNVATALAYHANFIYVGVNGPLMLQVISSTPWPTKH